jgi:hypothetical protein
MPCRSSHRQEERGLACPDDDVPVADGLFGQRVRRDAVDLRRRLVRRWPHRRHDDAEVRRVDHPSAHVDTDVLAGKRAEVPIGGVLTHREVGHPARRQQLLAHDGVEVRADLACAREFVEAFVPAVLIDGVVAERP